MSDTNTQRSGPALGALLPALYGAAAFVIVVAGLRAAESLVSPFLMAIFIAVLVTPPMNWLKKKGLSQNLSMTAVLLGLVISMGALIALMAGSLRGFRADLPFYHQRLGELTGNAIDALSRYGLLIDKSTFVDAVNPAAVMGYASDAFSSLGGTLTNGFLILLLVVFILGELELVPAKLRRITPNSAKVTGRYSLIMENLNDYMGIKSITSLGTGVFIGIYLAVLGVDYPLLWALLAFLLNFVPNIGSVIAAIPAVLLAIIQLGPASALWAAGGYFLVNNVVGNWLEPRLMGQTLGLSTFVVFLSLVFWGWVLGPVGMFLSVPLTMALKVSLESNEDTYALGVMLGSGKE